jgi:hypothetical protein
VTVTSADGVAGVGSSSPTTITIPAMAGSVLQCLADIDGDGATDIVVANQATGSLSYVRRTDLQMAVYDTTPIVIDAAMPFGTPGTAACRDVNGDGRVDIVTSFATPHPELGSQAMIVLYRAATGNAFERIAIPHGFPAGVVVGGLALADFDADRQLDLVAYAANNPPILDSQIFVFPNGGLLDPPFSQATRVSVPGTEVLASATAPPWGALTVRDWDSDGHPDIWALGNRGGLFLYRSLGGFQFAQPEFDGVIMNLDARFVIDAFDADRDGKLDLIVSGLDPGAVPRMFRGAGGGTLLNLTAPLSGTPTVGSMANEPPPLAFELPTTPPDIGLLKGSPVVTSYPDEFGVTRPSIFMVSVNGHLVERVQRAQYLSVTHTTNVNVPMGSPAAGSVPLQCIVNGYCNPTAVNVTSFREAIPTLSWVWIDHGMPEDRPATPNRPRTQTFVDSQPTVSLENFGGTGLTRRIFVRGGDGHLWELLQPANGKERWIDLGLPNPVTPPGMPDPTGGALVPLVGSPSAVAGGSGGKPATIVYSLDAAGRLLSFRHPTDEPAWRTHGPIGYKNCFGTPGMLGDGSPRAISYFGVDQRRHIEVFVVSAEGDLFSMLDGWWQEALDVQYGITKTAISPQNPPPASGLICPNRTAPDPWPQNIYRSFYQRNAGAHGTPDVAVYTRRVCPVFPAGSNCFTQLYRSVFVRGHANKLYEYILEGDQRFDADKETTPAHFAVPTTISLYVDITGQPTTRRELAPPFFTTGDNMQVPTSIISDPVAIVDAFGDLTVLATDHAHRLVMAHRSIAGGRGYEWDMQPLPGGLDPAQQYTKHVLGTAGARLGFLPDGTLTGIPALDIYAIRSTGLLIQGTARAGSGGHWATINAAACSDPSIENCASLDIFQWFTDAAHDHTPPVAPPILDNAVARVINIGNNPNTMRAHCDNQTVLDVITPAFISPQRTVADGIDITELYGGAPFDEGYDADALIEVEGVVVDTHIAAIDTPVNHTHGELNDIPRVHHDWNIFVALDIPYQGVLTDANMLAGGVMELEWEMADHLKCTGFAPETTICNRWERFTGLDVVGGPDWRRAGITGDSIPAVGDRVAVRGRFMFDCGHPPYRAEIHPIDVLAVIHRSDHAKLRFSQYGGSPWFQPGDANLPGEACQVQGRLGELGDKLVGKPDVTGYGPLNDFVASYEQLSKVIDTYEFFSGCKQYYDTLLISPANSCYRAYEHAINDKFPGVTTGPNANMPFTLPLNTTGFSFTIPGGATYTPLFLGTQGSTTVHSTPALRDIKVCFQYQPLRNHDGLSAQFGGGCHENMPEELVVWLTVNGQAKLYSEDEENCLITPVYSGDTLAIGTHGFECDFSCGEHWHDDFVIAPDDRIGKTRAAFTEEQNWGLQNGGPGTYVLTSQPDLATPISRKKSAGDYRMTITVSPP